MSVIWRTIAMAVAVAAGSPSGFGQAVEQPVILVIETEDMTMYRGDVTDATRLARDPGVTTPGPSRTFQITYNLADVVAINGKPAKGLNSTFSGVLLLSVTPPSGQIIADFNGGSPILADWQILGPDGTWIGSLWGRGASPPAPGYAILGGQGAFFGVTGELRSSGMAKPSRAASVTEDPANRRLHGGGKIQFTFYLYPKYRPSVDVTPTGPAVLHADFSPVTATSPARAGEVLIAAAKNLGPTRPDRLPPGTRPFKADPLETVNSPVEVTVNGRESEVLNAVGWPGTTDLYRLDFRFPSGIPPGMASVQLSAGWIPGPEVKIPAQ